MSLTNEQRIQLAPKGVADSTFKSYTEAARSYSELKSNLTARALGCKGVDISGRSSESHEEAMAIIFP